MYLTPFLITKILFPLAASIGAVPFKWDGKSKCLRRHRKNHRWTQIYILSLIPFILFLTFQSIRFKLEKDYNSFNLSYCALFLFVVIYQLPFLLVCFEDEAFIVINYQLSFYKHMWRFIIPAQRRKFRKWLQAVDSLEILFMLGLGLAGLIILGTIYIFPHAPMFPGYYVPETAPSFVKLWICYLVPFYSFAVVGLYTGGYIVLLIGVLLINYLLILREFQLDLKPKSRYVITPQFRKPRNIMLGYRVTQVMHQLTMYVVCHILVSTQSITTNLFVVSMYTLIRDGDRMNLFTKVNLFMWGSATAVYWCFILHFGGYVYLQGGNILKSWKRHDWGNRYHNRLMGKFRRSCRPLTISYQKMFTMRKLTMLRFVRGLTRGIFRMLLALGK